MNMREALEPDECDKVEHFFRFLLNANSLKQPGHKVDITKAIQEYRRTYGTVTVSEKQREHLSKTWDRLNRERYRDALEKYKAYPMGIVARITGLQERQVQRLYTYFGIERPYNYKGRKVAQ